MAGWSKPEAELGTVTASNCQVIEASPIIIWANKLRVSALIPAALRRRSSRLFLPRLCLPGGSPCHCLIRVITSYRDRRTNLKETSILLAVGAFQWRVAQAQPMVYCGKPSRGCQMCRTRRIKVGCCRSTITFAVKTPYSYLDSATRQNPRATSVQNLTASALVTGTNLTSSSAMRPRQPNAERGGPARKLRAERRASLAKKLSGQRRPLRTRPVCRPPSSRP